MNAEIFLLAAATGLFLNLTTAFAGSAAWLENPASGDWHTASNWTPGGPPNDPADTATFNSSTVSNLFISTTTRIGSITFNASGGTTYTISATTLDFFDSGITNNSGMTQNFVVLGGILFANSASAGSNIAVTVPEGSGFFRPEALFFDSSAAGDAIFTVNGSTQGDDSSGGTISFGNTSSAENATIIVNGSAFRHIDSPVDTPFPAAYLFFLDSTAGNATLIANGGIGTGDGGTIRFQGVSTGGTARIKVFGNGTLDISNHNFPPADVTIGSLEGDGLVLLGGHTLVSGSNGLNTNFSGVLSDRNPFGVETESQLTKIGTGTLTLSGANTYTGLTTIGGGTLMVEGSIRSPVAINNGSTLGGSGTTHSVSVNNGGAVALSSKELLHFDGDYLQGTGGLLKVEVANASPSSSGQLDITGNATLDGTLEVRFTNGFLPVNGQVFRLFHVSGALNGSFAQTIFPDLRSGFQFQGEFVNGYYQITALNDGVPATGFLNISTRMQVGTGDDALIGGFIVTGSVPKRVILRAIGPSLMAGGTPLPGRLMDPILELRDSAGVLLFSNDNWRESSQMQEIADTGIPPTDNNEAAIIATLETGGYTAIVRGVANTPGIGVVEVYDLAPSESSKLANISTRGLVQTSDNAMIGGFIADNQAMHVLIRALGPSLAQSGVPNPLADPTLELRDAQGTVLSFNDDWEETNSVAIQGTGIAPANEKESAILATLLPGSYTAIVRGKNDTTGVGLVEVYDLQ